MALLVALAWLLVSVRMDYQLTVPLPPRAGAIATPDPAPRAERETSPIARLPALPAADAPMLEAAATLQQLADAGHVEASCRLSIELLRCRQVNPYSHIPFRSDAPSMRRQYAAEEERLAAKGDLDGANKAAAYLMAYTLLESECAALGAGLDARAEQYLRQAALGGAREARIRYAAGDTMGLHGGKFGQLLTPEFDAWRREAPRLVQQAFEQGEPEALLLVLTDQRGGGSNFSMLEPASESLDLARLLLARRLFGDDPALQRFDRSVRVDEATLRAAAAQAQDWHLRYFKDGTARLADHTASLMPRFTPYREIEEDDRGWPLPAAQTLPDCAAAAP